MIDTFNLLHVMNLLIVEYRFMGCFECIGITGGRGGVMSKSDFGDYICNLHDLLKPL